MEPVGIETGVESSPVLPPEIIDLVVRASSNSSLLRFARVSTGVADMAAREQSRRLLWAALAHIGLESRFEMALKLFHTEPLRPGPQAGRTICFGMDSICGRPGPVYSISIGSLNTANAAADKVGDERALQLLLRRIYDDTCMEPQMSEFTWGFNNISVNIGRENVQISFGCYDSLHEIIFRFLGDYMLVVLASRQLFQERKYSYTKYTCRWYLSKPAATGHRQPPERVVKMLMRVVENDGYFSGRIGSAKIICRQGGLPGLARQAVVSGMAEFGEWGLMWLFAE